SPASQRREFTAALVVSASQSDARGGASVQSLHYHDEGPQASLRDANLKDSSTRHPALKRRATVKASLRDAKTGVGHRAFPALKRRATVRRRYATQAPGVETPGYRQASLRDASTRR